MQKITPHLWFDKEAKEATAFYVSIFPNSKITHTSVLTGTPSGDCDVTVFEIMGMEFQTISAGPYFKLNPSISFMVNFDPSQDAEAETRINTIWEKLVEGGKVLMPLQEYPFSKRYGWVEDKYGVSWQLILTKAVGEYRPLIMPALLFVGDRCGKAEEAGVYYQSVFKNSKAGTLVKYPPEMESEKEGPVMFSDFKLENQWFVAMDSAEKHEFAFNEAVSFIVNCETQEEIDYYWEKLSAVPESEQCGWCKDQFGVSWQIVPASMNDMMASPNQDQIDRVVKAFLPMKKLDIKTIEAAFRG